MTGPDRARGRRGAVAAALAAAALAVVALHVVTPASALAADEPATDLSLEELGAEVVVGYGRGPDQARWSPVTVTFSPHVPVVGDLVVRVDGPLGAGRRADHVEVAAGATKVVHLLVPPGPELSVRFTPRGGAPLELGGPGQGNRGSIYVGGLGAAPALPDTLASLGSDRPIEATAVDPALLDDGPRALEALDALLLDADELAGLDDEQRRTVSVAVAQGLDLVVPVGPGDDALPLPWDPVTAVAPGAGGVTLEPAAGSWAATADQLGTDGGERTIVAAVSAGDGRVVATAAAPGDGAIGSDSALWSALFQPRADRGLPFASIEQGGFSSGLFGHRISVPGSLGFALFVLVFVLVVGPVNALALRRWGRREFAWVTVPAVTIVFTLIAVGSGAARAPTTSPLVRAAWWIDGVGEELTAVGLQGASRGTATVDLPAGHDGIVAEPWSGLTATVARSADTTRVGVPLESLQSATVVGWGPAGAPPLEVAATFAGETLEVTLTNTSEAPLSDVELHLATRVERVDDLAGGETTTVVLEELPATLPRSRWADGNRAMMGMPMGGGARAREPDATAAVALLRGAVLDDAPGLLWVTGVLTDDPNGTVPRIAGNIEDRGTVVAVGTTPDRESGAVTPYEVQRHLLRTGHEGWRPSPLVIEGAQEVLVRFRLPAGVGAGDLVSTLDAGGPVGGGMDVGVPVDPWSGGCWEVTVTDADGNTGEPEERCGQDVACPRDAGAGCGGDERTVEACFDDGSCHVAVRVGDDTDAAPRPDISGAEPRPDIAIEDRAGQRVGGALAGMEVFDRTSNAFVPAADAFADGTGDADRLVSPLGDVLVRIRGGGFVDLGQRGLGVGGST